ncbi:SAM-dependent methyltransferase [Streptomyces sp. NPDC051555]|uniref:SAM-dependent methyltransferase n=1 Tax=Streptomyces sp. NPDC051555 TaxID=3365657 RepID=UPI00378FF267
MNLIEEGFAVGIPAPGEDHFRTAQPARIGNVWARGKDYFEADRVVAAAVLAAVPHQQVVADITREHGALSVRALAQAGHDQFLDLGCGFPPARRDELPGILGLSTHEIVHELQPQARIVYVDFDYHVIAHARVLYSGLTVGPDPVAVLADITRVPALLERLAERGVVDFERPVAVLLHDVLPWIGDRPVRALMADLRALLPAGSALSVSHAITQHPSGQRRSVQAVYRAHKITYRPRTVKAVRGLFGGWADLKGAARVCLVPAARYHPAHSRTGQLAGLRAAYAGIAVKPPRLDRFRTTVKGSPA